MEYFNYHIKEILVLLFLLITFGISSFEKITDWNGNVEFIKSHFINSPLKNIVSMLLAIILVLDIFACIFMTIGIWQLLFFDQSIFAFYGIVICALILIFLLIGQRLAKDYEGAMSLTVYFILSVFGLFLLDS